MYVYINSEPGLYTVGFYDPQGNWHPESDWNDRGEAAKRVAWLNGMGRDEFWVEWLDNKITELGRLIEMSKKNLTLRTE